jgi:hypothetical protein
MKSPHLFKSKGENRFLSDAYEEAMKSIVVGDFGYMVLPFKERLISPPGGMGSSGRYAFIKDRLLGGGSFGWMRAAVGCTLLASWMSS